MTMPSIEEELGRNVSSDEQALAREVKVLMASSPYEQLRAQQAGNQSGLHETRVRQITKTWANDGIVQTTRNGNLIEVTSYGERIIPRLADN